MTNKMIRIKLLRIGIVKKKQIKNQCLQLKAYKNTNLPGTAHSSDISKRTCTCNNNFNIYIAFFILLILMTRTSETSVLRPPIYMVIYYQLTVHYTCNYKYN